MNSWKRTSTECLIVDFHVLMDDSFELNSAVYSLYVH